MNVLTLTYNDYGAAGGTSTATYRHHRVLKENGINSHILCRVKRLEEDDSVEIPRSRVGEHLIREVTTRLGFNDLHGISAFNIRNHPLFKAADVLHLHSLHSGYFNYFALPRLTMEKPTIWSLHDFWAITGHCTYFSDCQRWKTGCGHCPYPKTYMAVRRDATASEWRMKKSIYKKSRLHLVVSSKWVQNQIKDSILGDFPIECIPWGVDTDIYKPLDKEECRRILGIPRGKKVLMFGAVNSTWKVKGADLLVKALQALPANLKKEIVLVTMGKMGEDVINLIDMQAIHLGFVENERFQAIIYSAADLFVLPSREETFGLTVIESMACGTPVAAFAAGPIPERVIDGLTGMTAEPENSESLAHIISQMLEDDKLRDTMARNSRTLILKDYSLEHQTQKYINLYKRLLKHTTHEAVAA